METIGIAVVFLVMLAAPCAIALRSSGKFSEIDGADALEPEVPVTLAAVGAEFGDRPLTLTELAVRAEGDAMIAKELAREAQCAALAAVAHAAKLRADAAIEAAQTADQAVMAAYLPGDHPSLDFPRSRQRRRAA